MEGFEVDGVGVYGVGCLLFLGCSEVLDNELNLVFFECEFGVGVLFRF